MFVFCLDLQLTPSEDFIVANLKNVVAVALIVICDNKKMLQSETMYLDLFAVKPTYISKGYGTNIIRLFQTIFNHITLGSTRFSIFFWMKLGFSFENIRSSLCFSNILQNLEKSSDSHAEMTQVHFDTIGSAEKASLKVMYRYFSIPLVFIRPKDSQSDDEVVDTDLSEFMFSKLVENPKPSQRKIHHVTMSTTPVPSSSVFAPRRTERLQKQCADKPVVVITKPLSKKPKLTKVRNETNSDSVSVSVSVSVSANNFESDEDHESDELSTIPSDTLALPSDSPSLQNFIKNDLEPLMCSLKSKLIDALRKPGVTNNEPPPISSSTQKRSSRKRSADSETFDKKAAVAMVWELFRAEAEEIILESLMNK